MLKFRMNQQVIIATGNLKGKICEIRELHPADLGAWAEMLGGLPDLYKDPDFPTGKPENWLLLYPKQCDAIEPEPTIWQGEKILC